ncbi:hypothetical protein HW130_25525 [Streptomyces sp. PKU-EA00015]|uniref:DUF6193 family natural product biosynthesis protein n=1 Tax=Streptomyces sp. PKU-EA00015 TaxID=2748326 RepID=UPI0015A168BB|nr:DUF6193 family natural product biosynthesis protein [Streptomyces sp. PKU-EA00015]NWF29573.1 hypothetical protein [Streptomyces sp. PKU-EA00015]
MSEQLPGAAPNDPLHEYAMLYPEVVRAGSLQNALQVVADGAGYGLTVELTSSPGWRHVAAQVAADGFSANVLMARGERSFSVDCSAGGIRMATGNIDGLSEVAGAMHSWLQGPRVRELVAQWPFLRTWELAEAHERGEAVPVRWRQLRAASARMQDTALHELVEAAFEQPRLRVLSPGRSMYWLTFSRRASPPICHDLPRAMPLGNGRYRVRFADGRVQDVDGAAEAVAVILDRPSASTPSRVKSHAAGTAASLEKRADAVVPASMRSDYGGL